VGKSKPKVGGSKPPDVKHKIFSIKKTKRAIKKFSIGNLFRTLISI
jgi:hypothetical protein